MSHQPSTNPSPADAAIERERACLAERRRARLRAAAAVFQTFDCVCGGRKGKRKAVCADCWKVLGPDTRRGLYCRIGHGFEGNYQFAVDILKQRGRIAPGPESDRQSSTQS